ncbi:MAG TPA: hypothetical protein VFP14_01300 [Novosphingobium sp.]|nr:hypothetical protein [Novosphingobium sp.]
METDRDFYERRLHEELARASHGDEGLCMLHRRWAELYRQRLIGLNTSGGKSANPRIIHA